MTTECKRVILPPQPWKHFFQTYRSVWQATKILSTLKMLYSLSCPQTLRVPSFALLRFLASITSTELNDFHTNHSKKDVMVHSRDLRSKLFFRVFEYSHLRLVRIPSLPNIFLIHRVKTIATKQEKLSNIVNIPSLWGS